MRKTLGMNRRVCAEEILKISHDALQDIEQGLFITFFLLTYMTRMVSY